MNEERSVGRPVDNRHERSILTVLTVSSAGAATPVTEGTDAGEADFTANAASVSVCGLWSGGVAALLSGYPLVFCCVHQLLFPCLEVMIQCNSPPRAVSYKVLPGCYIDVERLRVSHADVLVS